MLLHKKAGAHKHMFCTATFKTHIFNRLPWIPLTLPCHLKTHFQRDKSISPKYESDKKNEVLPTAPSGRFRKRKTRYQKFTDLWHAHTYYDGYWLKESNILSTFLGLYQECPLSQQSSLLFTATDFSFFFF